MIAISGMLLMLIICIALIIIKQYQNIQHAKELAQQQQEVDKFTEIMISGVTAYSNKKWNQAEKLFQQAAKSDPDNTLVSLYQNMIEKQQRDEKRMTQIKKRINENNSGSKACEDGLKFMRSLSTDSIFFSDVQENLSSVENELKKRLYNESRSFITKKQVKQAVITINKLHELPGTQKQVNDLKKYLTDTLQP